MPLIAVRDQEAARLHLKSADAELYQQNHILEPEFHQDRYVTAVARVKDLEGSFQLGAADGLLEPPRRGVQPSYEDVEDDPGSLEYEGMLLDNGSRLDSDGGKRNICAIKSICVRFGYVDLATSRSVSREFFGKRRAKAGVKKNDVLINSTGDGTIGRVAVYNHAFPALVDGHITIVRMQNADVAWYVAAFLLSEDGQLQIARYINGSSGQVEIYPQDIERLWIKPAADAASLKRIASKFRKACELREKFAESLRVALALV